jgi:hypothetical protein
MKQQDMPYGATLADNKKDYKLRVQYDRRFLNEAQIKVVTNYFYAVKTKDKTLFDSVMVPYYEDYAKSMSSEVKSTSDIINNSYLYLESNVGTGFDISMIDIVGAAKETTVSGIDTIKEFMDKIYEKNGQGKFSEKVTQAYCLTVDITVKNKDLSNIVSGDKVYLFQVGNDYFMVV